MTARLKTRIAAAALALTTALTATGPAFADDDDRRGRHHRGWDDDDDRRWKHKHKHKREHHHHHYYDRPDRRVVVIDRGPPVHWYKDRPWHGDRDYYRDRYRDKRDRDRVLFGVGGLVLGMALGSVVFRNMDGHDQGQFANTLESVPDGQPILWNNPNSGTQYSVTPMQTYQASPGQFCREYSSTAMVGGRPQETYGTACRQPDGSWKIVG